MKSPASELSTASTPRPPVASHDLVGELERARAHDVMDAHRRVNRRRFSGVPAVAKISSARCFAI